MKMQSKGFTLIELLIVVAIIAILAAIAVPNFLEAQMRAKVARSKANHHAYMTAIGAYRIDSNSALPPGPQYGEWSHWIWRYGFQWALTSPVPYMSTALEDPLWELSNAFGQAYFYEYHLLDNNIAKAVLTKGTQGLTARVPGMWTKVAYGSVDKPVWTAWREGMFKKWNHDNANYAILGRGPGGLLYYTYTILYDPTNGTISPGEIISYD
jgi:prepilin-type N-terminal cleavage/methylation domain-containing protein